MKVLISFDGSSEPFDVPPDFTVRDLKHIVKKNFLLQLHNNEHVHHYLEMCYGGGALWDNWALSDVGITSGNVIRCLIKSKQKPVIHVLDGVTGKTIPIIGTMALLYTSVARLKTIVSAQSGLPVSVFRLSTTAGFELYDCNNLQDYALEVGTVLHMDTWDGWLDFLRGCLLGKVMTVQKNLSEDNLVLRFQLRVALYIAASFGHLNLADWLLERKVHAEEPVGVHPCRQWCHKSAHSDTGKSPIHVAAAKNQLHILKLFISKNLLALVCCDPGGCDPLKIAIQHGHRDCVRYLASKLFSVVSLPNMSLPMRIYIKIKQWANLGQKRAALNRYQYTSTLLKKRVGDTLLIDGFNKEKMFSKSRETNMKLHQFISSNAYQHLQPISSVPDPLLLSKRRPQTIHTQHPVGLSHDEIEKQQEKVSQGDKKLNTKKVKLPTIKQHQTSSRFTAASSNSHTETTPLESTSNQFGRKARKNAMSSWVVASTFTELPFLKQLGIARTLVRKRIESVT